MVSTGRANVDTIFKILGLFTRRDVACNVFAYGVPIFLHESHQRTIF